MSSRANQTDIKLSSSGPMSSPVPRADVQPSDPSLCRAEQPRQMSSRFGLDICRAESAWTYVELNWPRLISSRVDRSMSSRVTRADVESSRPKPMSSRVSPNLCRVESTEADFDPSRPWLMSSHVESSQLGIM